MQALFPLLDEKAGLWYLVPGLVRFERTAPAPAEEEVYHKTSNTHLLMCCKGGEVND